MVRRPTISTAAYNYLPCTTCLGFFNKDTLSEHVKHCPLSSSSTIKPTNSREEGLLMITSFITKSTKLERLIIAGMKETKLNEGNIKISNNSVLL